MQVLLIQCKVVALKIFAKQTRFVFLDFSNIFQTFQNEIFHLLTIRRASNQVISAFDFPKLQQFRRNLSFLVFHWSIFRLQSLLLLIFSISLLNGMIILQFRGWHIQLLSQFYLTAIFKRCWLGGTLNQSATELKASKWKRSWETNKIIFQHNATKTQKEHVILKLSHVIYTLFCTSEITFLIDWRVCHQTLEKVVVAGLKWPLINLKWPVF